MARVVSSCLLSLAAVALRGLVLSRLEGRVRSDRGRIREVEHCSFVLTVPALTLRLCRCISTCPHPSESLLGVLTLWTRLLVRLPGIRQGKLLVALPTPSLLPSAAWARARQNCCSHYLQHSPCMTCRRRGCRTRCRYSSHSTIQLREVSIPKLMS